MNGGNDMEYEKLKSVSDDEVNDMSEQLIERNLKAYTVLANDVSECASNAEKTYNSSVK